MIAADAPNWQRWAVAVCLAAGLLFLACLGAMPLSDRDEGEYAASVAEMRRTGDFLIPRLNGKLYLEKPILVFWAVAGSQAVFGRNEFAARLPSALAGLLLTLILLRVAGRIGGPRMGVQAAAAFAFSPLVVLVGRAVLTDMLLTLFTTLSLLSFFAASEKQDADDLGHYLAAWLWLALGFLTKGPVALAVVLPAAFFYALLAGRLGPVLRRARIHWGVLIFLVVNLPWFGWAFYHLGDKFWQGFFVSQNFTRFSEVLLGHGGGFYYYLPVLLLGLFPFSVAAVPPMVRALGRGRKQAGQGQPAERLRLLATVSVLVTVAAFSLAATKQINYVLPAAPFMALLAAQWLGRVFAAEDRPSTRARTGFWIVAAFLAVLWAGALLAAEPLAAMQWERITASIRFDSSEYALPPTPPQLGAWPWLGAAAALAGVGLAWFLSGRKRAGGLAALLIGAALFSALTMVGVLGRVSAQAQEPAVRLAQEVRALTEGKKSLVFCYGLWKPSLLYYLDRHVPQLWVRGQVPAGLFMRKRPTFVFSRVRLAGRLRGLAGYGKLAEAGGYLLAGNAPARKLWARSRTNSN